MHWFWRAIIATMLAVVIGSGFDYCVFQLLDMLRVRKVFPAVPVVAVVALGVPCLIALAAYSALTRRQSQRDHETRCRKCGHILRGITEPRCPECGERI